MVGDKFRFRFRKTGDLRLLSHLDLTRCFERMLRRAAVPFRMTAGFHPTPRMVFALSLPLGAEGHNEVVELELTQPLDAEETRAKLNAQAPRGLELICVSVVPMKATAVPRRAVYTLPVPADRLDGAERTAAALLAQEKVWVDRHKPRPRRLNIRPYLRGIKIGDLTPWPPLQHGEGEKDKDTLPPPLRIGEGGGGWGLLKLDLWVTQTGTARLDELLKLLELFDLLDAGVIPARSELEVRDETPLGQPDSPPDGPPETAPLDHAPADAGDDAPADPEWALSPNGPVVE
jgi:radical SAM-linked protein